MTALDVFNKWMKENNFTTFKRVYINEDLSWIRGIKQEVKQ